MSHKVTVDAATLQDLIFNAGLMCAGQHNDAVVTAQCDALQACIDEQVGDSDTVYGRNGAASEDFSLTIGREDDNVHYLHFGSRRS